jgi:two-component system, cell cycle sensor histidine kinase and response regulator CckA
MLGRPRGWIRPAIHGFGWPSWWRVGETTEGCGVDFAPGSYVGCTVAVSEHGDVSVTETFPADFASSADAARDQVTSHLILAERLPSAHRMEALELLAAGVAHDFNNALSVILGFAELLADHVANDDTSREYVGEIARAGEKAAALMRQLSAFSGRLPSAPRRLDLNDLIRGLEDKLCILVGESITVVTSLSPVPAIEADVDLMEQVLVNLALYARDAMPNGGLFTVETASVHVRVPTGCPGHGIAVRSGSFVMLSCGDTSAGVSDVTRSRLLEPYFDAGVQRKGTGLRLACVYGIVRQAGGWVEVESAPGAGTTFTIFLPSLVVDEADAREESRAPSAF